VSGLSARLRASLRLRLAILGAAALLVVSAGGLIAATSSNPGPFTGCLSSKLGLMYNIAHGATPKAACFKGDTVVTFSNAQGPAGPTQALQVQVVSNLNVDVPPHNGAGGVAECPPGWLLTGGGYWLAGDYDPGVSVNGSAPALPQYGQEWVVYVSNRSDTDHSFSVHADCASLVP
jgi:hypothetical protein